jgi:Zn-dependent protease with chaperone function
MTQERFAGLVASLERRAAATPRLYRLQVAALTGLGFGYVVGVLALALGLLAGIVWAYGHGTGRVALRKGGIAIAYVVYAIGRAFWVRFERPTGMEIERVRAPALYAAIEETRRAMRAPRVHRVLLQNDLNAGVVQHPRLGILGWHENVLFLGLPLLQSLDEEQFRGVLAHEFGHLAGAHSRFGGWIQRLEVSWRRLLDRLEQEEHWSSCIFRPFFRWYAPYFAAYTFVLRRANELEADRDAGELSSPRALGDALVSLNLKGTDLEHRFWPGVQALVGERPEPDVAPYTRMRSRLARGPERADAEFWLPQYLAQPTTLDDTHPSLSDRLAALGVEPRVPPPVETSAADRLLGDHHAELARRLDGQWRSGVEERWRAHYQAMQSERERLARLDAEEARGELERDAAWERARLTERHGDPEAAFAQYLAFAERHPEHAAGRYAAGRCLLEREDARGIDHLERAMELADDAIVPACEHIEVFLRERGEDAKAESWAERGAAHQRHLDAVAEERGGVHYDATYLHHGLPAERLESLVRDLAAIEGVKRAWLVRRQLELSEAPLYVLGVERRRLGWGPTSWRRKSKPDDLALQDRILAEVPLPGETFVLVLNHRDKRDWALFQDVPGTRLLPAS